MHSTASIHAINPSVYLSAKDRHILLSRLMSERNGELLHHNYVGAASGRRWGIYAASRHELVALATWMEAGAFSGPKPLHQLASAVSGRELPEIEAESVLSGMLSNTDSIYRCEESDIGALVAFVYGFAHGAVDCYRAVQSEIGELS